MARLECTKCKSVYQDVIRVKKCPLCGNREFTSIEPAMPIPMVPRLFAREGSISFVYFRTIRPDQS